MKHPHPFRAFLLVICFTWLVDSSFALEWGDEIRITSDAVHQENVVMTCDPGDRLYAAWPEISNKLTTLYMIRSEDKGQTWTTPAAVTQPELATCFHIAADDTGLHMVHTKFDGAGLAWVFHSKSTDQGATFSSAVQISACSEVLRCRLFKGDGRLLVYIFDMTLGHKIVISDDGGASWQEETLLPGEYVSNPYFVLRDGVIHVTFHGFVDLPIAYSSSADDGATWATPVNASSGSGPHSQLPCMTIDDEAIHIAWEDDREDTFNIMYTRSTDNGATWSSDVRLNDTFYGARVKLHADADGLHAAWCQFHGPGWPGNWGSDDYGIIRYRHSDDAGATWSSEVHLSQNEWIPPLQYPSLGGNYVGLCGYKYGLFTWWQDKRDGNIEIYMRNKLPSLYADTYALCASTGSTIDFSLSAGAGNASRKYIVLGSATGTEPGTALPGGLAVLPLNFDLFTDMVFAFLNTSLFSGFLGVLDLEGRAAAQINMPALPPGYEGIELHFAYALNKPFDFVSNPVEVIIDP